MPDDVIICFLIILTFLQVPAAQQRQQRRNYQHKMRLNCLMMTAMMRMKTWKALRSSCGGLPSPDRVLLDCRPVRRAVFSCAITGSVDDVNI